MTPSREREIVQFTIKLDTEPEGRTDDIETLSGFIVDAVKKGECIKDIDNARMQIAISDAKVYTHGTTGDKALALLFDITDTEATIPANRDMKTRDTRYFDREDDEGRALSAHMVMSLKPFADGSNRFRALLEVASGLGRTRIAPHFQRVLKKIYKEQDFKVITSDGDTVKARPVTTFTAVRSDKLKDEIDQSEIKELVLHDTMAEQSEFDLTGVAKVRTREMRLKVRSDMVNNLRTVLGTVTPWAKKNNYDQITVRWKRNYTDSALEKNDKELYGRAKIDTNNSDIGETLFAKKHFISLDEDMTDCVEKICEDMVLKMLNHL